MPEESISLAWFTASAWIYRFNGHAMAKMVDARILSVDAKLSSPVMTSKAAIQARDEGHKHDASRDESGKVQGLE